MFFLQTFVNSDLASNIFRNLADTFFLQTCSLTIMDDIQNPSIEGSESFVVFLSSPQGAVLQEPYEANVVIIDTFQDSKYTGDYSLKDLFHLTFKLSLLTANVPSLSSQHAVREDCLHCQGERQHPAHPHYPHR